MAILFDHPSDRVSKFVKFVNNTKNFRRKHDPVFLNDTLTPSDHARDWERVQARDYIDPEIVYVHAAVLASLTISSQ